MREETFVDAARFGNLEMVRELVARGEHPRDMSGVALNCATRLEIFGFLFESGLFTERDVRLALFVALETSLRLQQIRDLTGNHDSVEEIRETYRQYIAPVLRPEPGTLECLRDRIRQGEPISRGTVHCMIVMALDRGDNDLAQEVREVTGCWDSEEEMRQSYWQAGGR